MSAQTLSDIRSELRTRLAAKISWERNELLNLIDDVIMEQVDRELKQLSQQSEESTMISHRSKPK